MQLFAGLCNVVQPLRPLCKACKCVQGCVKRAKYARNKTVAIFVESSSVQSCATFCRPVQGVQVVRGYASLTCRFVQ